MCDARDDSKLRKNHIVVKQHQGKAVANVVAAGRAILQELTNASKRRCDPSPSATARAAKKRCASASAVPFVNAATVSFDQQPPEPLQDTLHACSK